MTGAESPDGLLTTYQAAALLGISMDSVKHAIDGGTLLATTGTAGLSKRQRLRRRRADVEAYGANRTTWKRKIDGWEPEWKR